MNRLSFILLLGVTFFTACSKQEHIDMTASRHALTVVFDCPAQYSQTRILGPQEERRVADVNLYFVSDGHNTKHVYAENPEALTVELPYGGYTLYALANLGRNAGDLSPEQIAEYCYTVDDPAQCGQNGQLAMAAEQEISVTADMKISVSLTRAVAKVNFSYTVAPEVSALLRIKSVQLRSAPCRVALFRNNTPARDGDMADFPSVQTSAESYSASYYLLENMQGSDMSITDQTQKDKTRAPALASYIYIEAEADGMKISYRIYLGENNTSSFDIVRNKEYNIEIHILGINTVDWRISTTDVTVAPLATSYVTGEVATTQLRLVCTNDADNDYFLSYTLEKGDGQVTIDGKECQAATAYPLFSGNGTKYAQIAYRQQKVGDVRLRLTVTDKYGYRIERQITTKYANPPLTVTFIQEGEELAAMDRAYIDYTISQPEYNGTYKVTFSGTPTVFYGRYGSDIPETEFTLPGNGSYELRIKPEAVGNNPLTVVVADQQGNSTSFQPRIIGVLTNARIDLKFSLSGATLVMQGKSTYPFSEDTELSAEIQMNVTLSSGNIQTKYYTMTCLFEKGHETSMKASVPLDIMSSFNELTIPAVHAVFSAPTSQNGMVRYYFNSWNKDLWKR